MAWLFCLCAFGLGGAWNGNGQSPGAAVDTSIGPQAVKVLLKHVTINPLASDPNTHKPLGTDGSWSIAKTRPQACPQSSAKCVEVIYAVPGQSAKCSWVLALDGAGADGTILDENDDAGTYMVRTLSDSEAKPLIASRARPVTPPIAVAARVSGTVAMKVLVGTTGEIEHVAVVSGPAMLQQASLDAARKWTFKPMTINARPVRYEVALVFTFYPPIGSMPGAIKMTP